MINVVVPELAEPAHLATGNSVFTVVNCCECAEPLANGNCVDCINVCQLCTGSGTLGIEDGLSSHRTRPSSFLTSSGVGTCRVKSRGVAGTEPVLDIAATLQCARTTNETSYIVAKMVANGVMMPEVRPRVPTKGHDDDDADDEGELLLNPRSDQ